MENDKEKKFPTNPNDYRLYEEIGEGVSATVYRALCVPLDEIVAIKVLDLEKCNNDLDGIRREVQTMSLIHHPNVVGALCSFPSGHNLWVVMPYMAGGSALSIMKSAFPEGFEEPIIATLLHEVLKALVYLHGEGHIHRDVKAGNILIDAKGNVKLADFGVSACMFDAGDRQRSRNTFVGTPCWMAPEVMQQMHGYDFKADIWSFGITALELAHGHAPFSKYPPMKVLLMTLQNAPPGLDYERDKRFSKSFKDMVAICLVKDPKKRPTSEALLKHSFFKHARSKEYLMHALLDELSPLGDRYRTLKAKETNILFQNNAISEQLSQQEYMRGISGWNFNLEDLKAQAALIESFGSDRQLDHIDSSSSSVKEGEEGYDSPLQDQSERANSASTATSAEDGLQDLHELDGPFASTFPTRPLEALKSCFDVTEDGKHAKDPSPTSHPNLNSTSSRDQSLHSGYSKISKYNGQNLERTTSELLYTEDAGSQKFPSGSLLSDRVVSPYQNTRVNSERSNLSRRFPEETSLTGSFSHSQRDSMSFTSAIEHEEPPETAVIQRKGRFHITSADVGQRVSPSANSTFNSVAGTTTKTGFNAVSLVPSLQFLLHGNAMQKEQLVKLIKLVEQTSGASTSSQMEISGATAKQQALTSHKELQSYVTDLQRSIAKLGEEVQSWKRQNFQLEQKIDAMLSKGRSREGNSGKG